MKPNLEFNRALIVTAWVSCGVGTFMCLSILADGIRADVFGLLEVLLIFCFGVLAYEGAHVIVLWRIHLRTLDHAQAQPETAQPRQRSALTIAQVSEFPYRPQGYVYVIRDQSVTGYVKIGRTNHPVRRITEFGVKLPFEIAVLSVTPADHAGALESALHAHYHAQRVRGEWFALDERMLDILINYLDHVAEEVRKQEMGA